MAARRRPASASVSRDQSLQLHSSSGGGGGGSPFGVLSSSVSSSSLVGSGFGTQRERPRERDAAELKQTMRELKEQLNVSLGECAFLKTQVQRLIAQGRKKDKLVEHITALQISALGDSAGGGDSSVLGGQLRELRSEMASIARLGDKFRDLEAEGARKDAELRKLRANVKLTQAKELELENQTFYNELRRTRKAMLAMQAQIRSLQQGQGNGYSASNGYSFHPGSPSSSGAAYDQQMVTNLRAEVAQLRSENLRLRSAAPSGTGSSAGSARGPSSSTGRKQQLHVLNTIAQLQRDLQQMEAAESGNGSHAGEYASSFSSSSHQQSDEAAAAADYAADDQQYQEAGAYEDTYDDQTYDAIAQAAPGGGAPEEVYEDDALQSYRSSISSHIENGSTAANSARHAPQTWQREPEEEF